MVKPFSFFSKSDNNIIGLVAFVLDSPRAFCTHNTSGQMQECKSNNHHNARGKVNVWRHRRKFLGAPISDNSFLPLVNQCANMASCVLLSPTTVIDDVHDVGC